MRSTTKNVILAIAASMLAASGLGQARGGDITYNLVNYQSYQEGWTLSGSITTDGTLGILTERNIISWTWTVTYPSFNSYTYASDGIYSVEVIKNLQASAYELYVPVQINSGQNEVALELASPTPAGGISVLGWITPSSTGFITGLYQAQDTSLPFLFWYQIAPPATGPGGSLIIAGSAPPVPEPSSIVLAGMAGVSCIAYGQARKQRARRKATSKS